MTYLPALCSVPGCDEPPREEFALPEGFLAVACDAHCRHVEGWAKSPLGAPSGARLLATLNSNPPTGPVLRHIATDENMSRAVKVPFRPGIIGGDDRYEARVPERVFAYGSSIARPKP